MTAAIALAVVLVIAVAGMSLAMQTQRPTAQVRPVRPAAPRRPARERRPAPAPPAAEPKIEEPRAPELLRIGTPGKGKVIAVVDERTTGSIVRSRLNLRVEPDEGEAFEVQVRHAFQSHEDRAKVKVGGTVAVRYDPDDHTRVVLAPDD
ncbi:MAG TPA: hypothetical protein VG184_01645 [Acidimicrobiales bacterium]|nr:hypothetical protein [Acidimicrobiales bacterium]